MMIKTSITPLTITLQKAFVSRSIQQFSHGGRRHPLLEQVTFQHLPLYPLCQPFLSSSTRTRGFSSDEHNNIATGSASSIVTTSTTSTTTPEWKIAIVGSGPSGCYTAKYLQQAFSNLHHNNNNSSSSNSSSSPMNDVENTVEAGISVDNIIANDSNKNNNNKINSRFIKNIVQIDILERLPTPYGLVRNGVAPDHPEVKNVQNDFDAQVFGTKTSIENDDDGDHHRHHDPNNHNQHSKSSSTSVGIHFWGNVHVGRDITLYELRQRYDIVILSFGCESDRSLNIPNYNTLDGILSARQFVHWYNGHPDYEHVGDIVERALYGYSTKKKENNDNDDDDEDDGNSDDPSSHSVDISTIVVIGHGNVALDCARILAKTHSELDQTDLTTRALNVLWNRKSTTAVDNDDQYKSKNRSQSNANTIRRKISIVGRRGHVQAAFTIKEIRELTKLSETSDGTFRVLQSELESGKSTTASQGELKSSKPKQRLDALLNQHAIDDSNESRTDSGGGGGSSSNSNDGIVGCRVDLRFLLSPIRFEPKGNDDISDDDGEEGTTVIGTAPSQRLGAVICEKTRLVGDIGRQSANGTGVEERLDADLCLVSIGYKGIPIEGTEQYYDESRGILKNIHGVVDNNVAVVGKDSHDYDHLTYPLAPLYVSGWLKRGPSGIIGTNIADAKDTVASIMKDVKDRTNNILVSPKPTPTIPLRELLEGRGVQIVDWSAYQRINDMETSEVHKRNPKQPREKIVDREDLLRVAAPSTSLS
jgi:adrenodoxin-NADP+ reductase